MSNPHSRRPGGSPPTPSRNFSHPRRQRDPSLSPEYDQDSPSMAPNDSRYMLPILPSRLFARSASNISLPAARRENAHFDFGYEPSARPGTAHKAFSSVSTPDLTATALPQMPSCTAPPMPQIPHQFGGPTPVAIVPPSLRQILRSTPPSPAKSGKSSKGSGWRRVKSKVKKMFGFKQKKKLQISGPRDFRHEQTFGGHPLRAPGTGMFTLAPRLPASSGSAGTGTTMGAGLRRGLGRRPSSNHGAGARTQGSGPTGRVRGLGHQDAEGTAMSDDDDDDSEWEDQEATRIFQAQEQSQEQRH